MGTLKNTYKPKQHNIEKLKSYLNKSYITKIKKNY